MKCWKCTRTAVVHLTDLVTQADGKKRAIETHLCLEHAAEAQLLAAKPMLSLPPKQLTAPATPAAADAALPTAIVPTGSGSGSQNLSVIRKEPAQIVRDIRGCPVCGMTWAQFKQHGLMGCAHDYTVYNGKLLPLIKRAQEGATQHVGKVPAKLRTSDPVRLITQARLRRELEQALAVENYEHAARVRDQLKAHEESSSRS